MNRPKSIAWPLVVVVAVVANNLAWVYVTRDRPQPMADQAGIVQRAYPTPPRSTHSKPAEHAPERNVRSPGDAAEVARRDPGGASRRSPAGAAIQDSGIPVQQSETFILERQRDLETFFQGDTARKLQTIEALTPQGEALGLLKQILEVEADHGIRIAALNRLKLDNNYVAMSLLIDAMDDPAPEVAVAAVQALAATGDRTLLPLLNERLASLPNGSIRDQYARSIRQLEYSVTMAMDGLER